MKIEATKFLPLARRDAIITKEVDGELLVYDVTRDKAHCLNETAAAVWRLCDGRSSVSEISEQLAVSSAQQADGSRQKADGISLSTQHSALSTSQQPTPDTRHSTPASDTRHPTPDTQIVWLALDQLRRSHLLDEATAAKEKTFWPAAIPGLANMSRREAVRRIGLGAAITLPIVVSMTAPTAVQAAVSCSHHCASCTTSSECCGVCTTGVPGCTTGLHCT
ncbi:MAG TPA: hypothetical protein DC047_19660 [Blastocatellia bacterium]|nr:hypothetical protein [Blastocatellia bacterium]